jgi:hypothetical protein
VRTLLLAALAVGCGSRVVDDALTIATDANADTDATASATDVFVPPDCPLRENACYRSFVAAVDRARSCFPHFGGTCGAYVSPHECHWGDGARAPWWMFNDGVYLSASGESCVVVAWHPEGEIRFADGTVFRVGPVYGSGGASGPWIGCAEGSFRVLDLVEETCGDGIRTCCGK